MLDKSVDLHVRTNRLIVKSEILKGRISPIETLLDSINMIIDSDPVAAKKKVKGICFLKSVEKDFKGWPNKHLRVLQRAISLHIGDKLVDCPRARLKFTDDQWKLVQENLQYIKSCKISVVKLTEERPVYLQNIVRSPLLFTKFSDKKY